MKNVQMEVIEKIVQKRSGAKNPDRIKLSATERSSAPELKDVVSLRPFSTMTGWTLVCLTTDPLAFAQARAKSFAAAGLELPRE